MKQYGLVGKNISYSFSKNFFSEFFRKHKLDCSYENFDLQTIDELQTIVSQNPNLAGLNVTIPYKEQIIPFLDELDDETLEIGAVNTIKFDAQGKMKGFNTDHFGFSKSLLEQGNELPASALVLGTGGASKAVAFALNKLAIPFQIVSRKEGQNTINYNQLTEKLVSENLLIINCTPLGTFPEISQFPDIPYSGIGAKHLLFDLIYNPEKTTFLQKGVARGAKIVNGAAMLHYQALRSWELWNK